MHIEPKEMLDDFIALCQKQPTKYPSDIIQDAFKQHFKCLYEQTMCYQDERKTPIFSYGDISDNSQYVKD